MQNNHPLQAQPQCELAPRFEHPREPEPALPDWAPQGYVDCSYWPDDNLEAESESETLWAVAA